jgi:hypothetical protein
MAPERVDGSGHLLATTSNRPADRKQAHSFNCALKSCFRRFPLRGAPAMLPFLPHAKQSFDLGSFTCLEQPCPCRCHATSNWWSCRFLADGVHVRTQMGKSSGWEHGHWERNLPRRHHSIPTIQNTNPNLTATARRGAATSHRCRRYCWIGPRSEQAGPARGRC